MPLYASPQPDNFDDFQRSMSIWTILVPMDGTAQKWVNRAARGRCDLRSPDQAPESMRWHFHGNRFPQRPTESGDCLRSCPTVPSEVARPECSDVRPAHHHLRLAPKGAHAAASHDHRRSAASNGRHGPRGVISSEGSGEKRQLREGLSTRTSYRLFGLD